MMAFKYLIIHTFSIIFAVFITLNLYVTRFLVLLASFLNLTHITNTHLNKRQDKLKNELSQRTQYIQIIANSSISLILSFTIINYHQNFIYLIWLISHEVHRWFINFIIQVPEYSIKIQNIIAFRGIICYIYIIYGYIGLSSQITLTLDLIYLFNMPTILIYKLLARTYQFLLKITSIIKDILTINKQYWLTCPYPDFLLSDGIKLVYISTAPVIAYLIIVTVFYYFWLTIVIIVLKMLINLGKNIAKSTEQIGSILLAIKGIKVGSNNKMSKSQNIRLIISHIDWNSILTYEMIVSVFRGKDLFDEINMQKQSINLNIINLANIYYKIASLGYHSKSNQG